MKKIYSFEDAAVWVSTGDTAPIYVFLCTKGDPTDEEYKVCEGLQEVKNFFSE